MDMNDEMTIIVVTRRFVIAVDAAGNRERVETAARATVAVGHVLSRGDFCALRDGGSAEMGEP